MPKKKPQDLDEYILAHELSLDEWIGLLGTNKGDRVYPNNCFPTDRHKEEYLSKVKDLDEKEIKKLARHFLNKSQSYGIDRDRFSRVIKHYTPDKVMNDEFDTEFDRRSIPKNSPQWEGITWVLDLLPNRPQDALAALSAYRRAHLLHFTSNMFYGHNDVEDMIREKYDLEHRYSCFISYGGPDKRFAQKLYDSLEAKGVEAFIFHTHATGGMRLHTVMREGVNQAERTILICSQNSLDRPGVLNEITETLQREARDGGKDYLIPIKLDDYVFTRWQPDKPLLAQAVRDRVILDFTGTMRNKTKYEMALSKLLSAIKRQPSEKKNR